MKNYTSVDNYRNEIVSVPLVVFWIQLMNIFLCTRRVVYLPLFFIVIPVLVYFLRQQTVLRQSTKRKVE